MTSYLVEAVLLLALLATTVRVTQMHRDLKKLRSDQAEFCSILGEAASAFDTIVRTVNDLNCDGTRLIQLLGVKIDEARQVMAAVDDGLGRAAGVAATRRDNTTGETSASQRAIRSA
jgi:hypothetical protein